MELEDVAKLAQNYLRDVPVLVLGSGASIPFGLPSMWTLSQKLVEDIKFEQKVDKEIWELFKAELETSHDLEKALHDIEINDTVLNKVINTTWKIINNDDLIFFDSFLQERNLPLSRLLNRFTTTASCRMSIITTNYDRLIEYACAKIDAKVFTGFTYNFPGKFVSTISEVPSISFPNQTRQIDIWKVHGSIDWFQSTKNNSCIWIPQCKKVPENYRPAIVTPGTTKYKQTHNDPFRTIMTNADKVIASASTFMCVGYGFNDEHVQPKLIERVKNFGVPLVLLTKKISESTKTIFLNGNIEKFLLIEEGESGGSKLYHKNALEGEEILDYSIWNLEIFNKKILGL